MNIDEILTGTVGFIVGMMIVGGALGGALYGYYLYAQHQILENYLWPVVDVVPAQGGGYYMAVINTGHEPIFVKYVIYPNGESQAVDSGVLYHNQHWLAKLSQAPAAVMVCSAINPGVCTVAKANGWQPVIPGMWLGGVVVNVTLYDSHNAYWQVSWTYLNTTAYRTGNTSDSWVVVNNGPVHFTASITGNPLDYACTISPSSITAGPGQSITFIVSCSKAITVIVDDQAGAPWTITWVDTYGWVEGSKSGSTSESWTITASPGDTVYLTPYTYSSCEITPYYASAQAGDTVTFTVNCNPFPW